MAKEVLPEQLMNSVLGKLYDVLTNGDDVVPKSDDNYLAWLSVGSPTPKTNWNFCLPGLRCNPPAGNSNGENLWKKHRKKSTSSWLRTSAGSICRQKTSQDFAI